MQCLHLDPATQINADPEPKPCNLNIDLKSNYITRKFLMFTLLKA